MIGQKISHYQILEKLGEGGMGVVYKAQDTKLDRLVALKFLPPHVSSSDQDKSRFIQEAKAAAALNHPNICTIHGIEEENGQTFIVMELVEGQTLHDRGLNVPLKQSIEIGIQLADGLAAAHEKGIVHRDIKPENIMIQKDGRVRIMDFGLAKLKSASRLTKAGSTVGTTGYMSPEQVQGLESDHRSDIFSMGVIFYELFSGQSPFKGVHETAINYEIVNVDPDPISSVKPDIGPELDSLVLECLEKDPNERAQSAKQVAIDLKRFKRESSKSRMSRITSTRQAYASPAGSVDERAETRRTSLFLRYGPWVVASVSLLSLLAVFFLRPGSSSNDTSAVRAFIPAPEKTNFYSYGGQSGPVVVSPNGRMIAFVAIAQDGRTTLYLRSLDGTSSKPMSGTDGGYYPFWSPDSKWLGFFANGRLKKVDVAGNPPVTVCQVDAARGGSWMTDGTILFASGPQGPISAISAAGGTPTIVTALDTSRNESAHRWPHALPDGKHFLYYARTASAGGEAEGDAVFVASTDFKTNKKLVSTVANAIVVSGRLLFMRGATLLAQDFDEGKLDLKGDPVALAEGVINDPGFNLAVFSASENGILAYETGVGISGARMMITDRNGKELGFIGDVIEHFNPCVSPDGKRLATFIFEPRSRTYNLWLYDLARNARRRFTTGFNADLTPMWSPDGSQIAFISIRKGLRAVYLRPSEGGGTEEQIDTSSSVRIITDWSHDGKYIATERYGAAKGDIWMIPRSGEKKPFAFLQTQFNEGEARFSPDGRWVAYSSNETGQVEVFVRPFPGPGTGVKVSSSGGYTPKWNPDGKEIYYISTDNKTMAAEIRVKGSNVEVGAVRPLFTRTPMMGEYDLFPDGKRFLINRLIEPKETDPITIVVNWTEMLKKK
jgi:serine/threonine protein kinase